jgi:putative membrane protein insertion efficiency factor
MMRRLLMALVRFYQLFFSAWLNAGCRYSPSCSAYAMQALERHGAAAGSYLAARRLLRCHPFCLGGHDPVPDRAPRLFRHLVPDSSPRSHP